MSHVPKHFVGKLHLEKKKILNYDLNIIKFEITLL